MVSLQTKLSREFLRRSLVIGVIGSALIGLASFTILSGQVEMISDQEINAASARAKALTQFLPKELIIRVQDWGDWDEAFDFVTGKNPQFSANYLTRKSVADAGVNAITVLRLDGSVAGQIIKGNSVEFSTKWGKIINNNSLKEKLISRNHPISGYVIIDGKLIIVAAKLIRPTADLAKFGGIMIMGREVTSGELSDALQTGVVIGGKNSSAYKIFDQKAEVNYPLEPLLSGDKPSLTLAVNLPASHNARIQQVVQTTWLVILSLLFALFTVKLLEKLVTRRIVVLEKQMDDLARQGFQGRLPPDNVGDEISSLSQKFNQLIEQLARRNFEERKLRIEMQSALDLAVKSERTKSNFVAVTSHEIRTPLAAVLGGIELLQMQINNLSPDVADIAKRLESSGERLRNIVDDVLDFSRIEHEGVPFELNPTDLSEVTGRIVDSYDAQAVGKGLNLSFRSGFPNAVVVLTDAFRLQQVLGNLISNAIKFTSEGSVLVSLERLDNEHFRFSVTDTGLGINPSQIEHLFRPFAQADQSTARRFGGTGLGLSICKRIVEAMGGEIGVDSKPGNGSTFWFQLPLKTVTADAPSKLTVTPSGVGPVDPERALSILVVEDNQMVQSIVMDQLSIMGHRPTCVSNGVAAFNAASTGKFDAVLMDMHMPLMDGVKATKAIQALGAPRSSVPIIALTADADKSRRGIYKDCRFHHFLTKPCSSFDLADALESINPRTQSNRRSTVSPSIDPSLLLEIEQTMGSDALSRYLNQFVHQLELTVNKILSYQEEHYAKKVAEEAHSLKGAARTIGAVRMQKVLASLEVRARSGMPWQGLRAPLLEATSDLRIVLDAMNN